MDALLGAYRVGARVSWRELAATAVEMQLPAPTLAQFAELVAAEAARGVIEAGLGAASGRGGSGSREKDRGS